MASLRVLWRVCTQSASSTDGLCRRLDVDCLSDKAGVAAPGISRRAVAGQGRSPRPDSCRPAGWANGGRRWQYGRVPRALKAVHAGDLATVAAVINAHHEAVGRRQGKVSAGSAKSEGRTTLTQRLCNAWGGMLVWSFPATGSESRSRDQREGVMKMNYRRAVMLLVALVFAALHPAGTGTALATPPDRITIPTSGTFVLA